MAIVPIPPFPFDAVLAAGHFQPGMFAGAGITISINSGLITLLGPNGSGKTSALRALRDNLRATYGEQIVRYVSAGRMGVLEQFRSDVAGTGMGDVEQTYTGHQNHINARKKSETVTGDFITLEERPDIRLKVESRLQGIFGRTLILTWGQNGLKIHFKSTSAGASSYGAGAEASGLTQLVALLAALYDDEIKFLLLDEPEVSLHPQLQAFILKEIKSVAGNPTTAGKKIVVISTHSPGMLPLKVAADLSSIVFFRSAPEIPVQIPSGDAIYADQSLGSLIIRLSELHKIALFSKSVLLSEGVSDGVVLGALVEKDDDNFSSSGNQVISVSGKGELKVANKLFLKVGKKVSSLGDLDILDDDDMITYFDNINPAIVIPAYANLAALYLSANTDLNNAIATNWQPDIDAAAQTQKYWQTTSNNPLLQRKRSILSYLLSTTPGNIASLTNTAIWQNITNKFTSLLDSLDSVGLFLIRKGSIEDCFICTTIPPAAKKPVAASIEAAYISTQALASLEASYSDVLKATRYIKQQPNVNEAALVRTKLGSLLGAIWANPDRTSNDEIQAIVENADRALSKIFRITQVAGANPRTLNIEFISPLFSNYTSPIQHSENEPVSSLAAKIPS